MMSRRAGASFRLPKMVEEQDLAHFAMEINDLLEKDPDFEPEIPQTGLDRENVLQDYINSSQPPVTLEW